MHVVSDTRLGEVTLAGRLDVSTVAVVREMLHAALDEALSAPDGGDIVVDLTAVDVLDATGLGVLVGAHRRARACGLRLVLRGVPPRLARVLATTRLHRILYVERPAVA